MLKLLFTAGAVFLMLIGCRHKDEPDAPFAVDNPFILSAGERQTSDSFMKSCFPAHYLSATTTINSFSYGCFHSSNEFMHIKTTADTAIILLETAEEGVKRYKLPARKLEYLIKKFYNGCASLLRQQQQKVTDSNRTMYSTTVNGIAIDDGINQVRIFYDNYNPYSTLKYGILRHAVADTVQLSSVIYLSR